MDTIGRLQAQTLRGHHTKMRVRTYRPKLARRMRVRARRCLYAAISDRTAYVLEAGESVDSTYWVGIIPATVRI